MICWPCACRRPALRSDTLVSASIDSEIRRRRHAASRSPARSSRRAARSAVRTIPTHRIPIGSAEFGLDWDITRRTLRVPFKVTAGAARYTLRSEFAAPAQPGGNWMFALGGGWIVLDPPAPNDEGLILKRVVVRGSIDPDKQRITLEHGDLGTKELGSQDDKDVTIALSGKLDYGAEPRLAIGIAGNQMSAGAFKRLWPVFVAPKVRDWVVQHIVSGTVERHRHRDQRADRRAAAGRPADPGGGPVGRDRRQRRDAAPGRWPAADPRCRPQRARHRPHRDGHARPGHRRRVARAAGSPSPTACSRCPTRGRWRRRRACASASMARCPAAAELLALDRLREFSGAPFDPATTRGTLSAQVNLAMPLRPDLPKGSTDYNIAVDLTNFTAEKMMFGQKVEAQTAARHRHQPALRDQGRRQDRAARRPRSSTASRPASPTPRSSCRRRSTKRRARGSGSISAAASPARCR